MKDYVAIVKTANNRVIKLQDFDAESDANAHVATYGGFVVENPGGGSQYWVIDASKKTATLDEDAQTAAKNTVVWKRNIRNTDVYMPRICEDIIDSMDSTQKGNLSKTATDNYNAKKVVRGEKP